MANEKQLAILKRGVDVWNKWRKRKPNTWPNLAKANLCGANLSGANLSLTNFHEAKLNSTDLSGANLNGVDLFNADLREADLGNAYIRDAELSGADLSDAILNYADLRDATLIRTNLSSSVLVGANLSKANLSQTMLISAKLHWTNFSDANLSLANFTSATFAYTNLGGADLRDVIGIETVNHEGPSYIDILTIYRSRGSIPEVFLSGAGVPDNFITHMKSLTGKALEFYSCFISYSSKDHEFAERLYSDLRAKGVQCWYDQHDIQGGKKIHEQIDQAIRVYDKLLLVLSEHSMSSEWVKTEVYNARQQETKENKRKLFPIRLVGYDRILQWQAFDADLGKDMAREVREYFIPDFTNWKDYDAYQNAFYSLLRDLKAEG